MVDVSAKPATQREATARAVVRMKPETLRLIQRGEIAKGEVFAVARVAGIMAAKCTANLIPLCHPLPIQVAAVDLRPVAVDALQIEARVKVTGNTGVEMEALTAASVAALTVYDMCKAVDRGMVITEVRLIEKKRRPQWTLSERGVNHGSHGLHRSEDKIQQEKTERTETKFGISVYSPSSHASLIRKSIWVDRDDHRCRHRRPSRQGAGLDRIHLRMVLHQRTWVARPELC